MAVRALPAFVVRLSIAILLVLAGAAVGAAVVASQLDQQSPEEAALVTHDLPGAVMDFELMSDSEGIASLSDGTLVRFTLDGDGLTSTVVAEGLVFPRGVALDGDTIYVVDSDCNPADERCQKSSFEEEGDVVRRTNGRVLAYPLAGGEPREVIDRLPVIGRDHAPNDLDVGPDGMLYLSIGNLDYAFNRPEVIDHPNEEWLGTVLRIHPESGDATVFAEGLRNVYGLAWTDDGRLIGVDNDGPALNGWRDEELIEIREGGHHGYPADRSVGPGTVRTSWPILTLHSAGHAGIAWSEGSAFVGDCGTVARIPLRVLDDALILESAAVRPTHRVSDGLAGCVTSIAVRSTGSLLVGVFGGTGGALVEIPTD